MTEDIEHRSDNLTAREAQAGGPEALVNSLVTGLKRQGRYIFYTAVSVALDIILSVVLFVVALEAVHTANHSATNTTAIAHLQQTETIGAYNQCLRSVQNTMKINATDRAFVTFLQGLSPAADDVSQANRIAFEQIYKNAELTVPVCDGP